MSKRNRKNRYVQIPKLDENGAPVNAEAEAPETPEEKAMDYVEDPVKQDGFFKRHWKKLAAGGAALIAAAGGVFAIFANRDKEETDDDPETENNGPKVSLDDIGEKLDSLLSKFDELE